MNTIKQQRNYVDELFEVDNDLLDACIEASFTSCIDDIKNLQRKYKTIKKSASKDENDIISEFCEKRIWFWSIRVSYVTGKSEYQAPSILCFHGNSKNSKILSRKFVIPLGDYDIEKADYLLEFFKENLCHQLHEIELRNQGIHEFQRNIQMFDYRTKISPSLFTLFEYPILREIKNNIEIHFEMAFYNDKDLYGFSSENEEWLNSVINLFTSSKYESFYIESIVKMTNDKDRSVLLYANIKY